MNHFKLKCNSLAPSIILLFLFFLPFCTISGLNPEKQALLAFANSVRHGQKLNWKPNTPICSTWVGVTCTKDQTHVLALRLPGIGLSGEIPPNTIGKLYRLQILSLRSNLLNGSLPSDVSSLPSLRCLYLQHNALTGNIPTSLSSGLSSLDLSYNSFSGGIPVALRNLSQLTILNLQNNSLSGPIPDLKLKMLRHLNFSYNSLNGSIPFSLQKFPNDSYAGNIQLCGPPLPQCSSILPSPSPQPTLPQNIQKTPSKKLTRNVIIVITAGGLAVLLLLIIILMLCVMKKRGGEGKIALKTKGLVSGGKIEKPKDEYSSGVQMAEKNKLVFFDGCLYTFDLEDLLRASAEILGKGSYGTTYKAALEDGTMVVVKRLKEVVAGKKEFEQQMEMIERVGQHPNLVSVRAYYYSKDEKLLVYDYSPHGSFSSVLHGRRFKYSAVALNPNSRDIAELRNRGDSGRTPLDWDTRLKILLAAAKGIAHIHAQCGNKFAHGNIKSSNILLTQDHSATVSDYALTPLMNPPSTTSQAAVGYRAPEFIETRKPTTKSDIYSFGVVMLEMLTGKSPIQAPGCDDVVDLPRWVHSIVREEWTAEVFDMELVGCGNIEEEMVCMLQLGMACVSRVAEQRPTMVEVVRMIEEVRRPDSESWASSEAKGSEVDAL